MLTLLEVLVEENLAITKLLQQFDNGKYTAFILNVIQADVIEALVKILKAIQEITDLMAAEIYITASAIYPLYYQLN